MSDGNKQLVETTSEKNMIEVIAKAASNPNVDIDKMERLLDFQIKMMNKQSQIDYASAISEMQSELPTVSLNKSGHNNKYATFDNIKSKINPILSKYGFKDLYFIKQDEKLVTVTVKLMHKSGHSEETSIQLPHDTVGSKNPVQAIGSTISYGRRYCLLSILGIATGDDNDAQAFIATCTAKKIKRILEESKLDVSEFLKKMNVDCVENILSKDFEKANIELGRKLKEQKPLFNN